MNSLPCTHACISRHCKPLKPSAFAHRSSPPRGCQPFAPNHPHCALAPQVIVNARKPDFFNHSMSLYEIVTEDGLMKPAYTLRRGGLYCGGSGGWAGGHSANACGMQCLGQGAACQVPGLSLASVESNGQEVAYSITTARRLCCTLRRPRSGAGGEGAGGVWGQHPVRGGPHLHRRSAGQAQLQACWVSFFILLSPPPSFRCASHPFSFVVQPKPRQAVLALAVAGSWPSPPSPPGPPPSCCACPGPCCRRNPPPPPARGPGLQPLWAGPLLLQVC